jgi:hypothetical protein
MLKTHGKKEPRIKTKTGKWRGAVIGRRRGLNTDALELGLRSQASVI